MLNSSASKPTVWFFASSKLFLCATLFPSGLSVKPKRERISSCIFSCPSTSRYSTGTDCCIPLKHNRKGNKSTVLLAWLVRWCLENMRYVSCYNLFGNKKILTIIIIDSCKFSPYYHYYVPEGKQQDEGSNCPWTHCRRWSTHFRVLLFTFHTLSLSYENCLQMSKVMI